MKWIYNLNPQFYYCLNIMFELIYLKLILNLNILLLMTLFYYNLNLFKKLFYLLIIFMILFLKFHHQFPLHIIAILTINQFIFRSIILIKLFLFLMVFYFNFLIILIIFIIILILNYLVIFQDYFSFFDNFLKFCLLIQLYYFCLFI